jgi:hypothetical protein
VNGYNRRAMSFSERFEFRMAGRVRGAILLNGNRYDQVAMDPLGSESELKHVAPFRDLERRATSRSRCGTSHPQPRVTTALPVCGFCGDASLRPAERGRAQPSAHNAERFAPSPLRQAGLTPGDAAKLKMTHHSGVVVERLGVGEWRNVIARAAKTRALVRGFCAVRRCGACAPAVASARACTPRP